MSILGFKFLSALDALNKTGVDGTTKLITTSGIRAANYNLLVSEFIADNFTTTSSYLGLSARAGKELYDTKAPINNPTFTGTVNGVTKAMVGLGNVDNTSDAQKAASSAFSSIYAKSSSPIFSGVVDALSANVKVATPVDDNNPVSLAYLKTRIPTPTAGDIGKSLCYNGNNYYYGGPFVMSSSPSFTGDVTVTSNEFVINLGSDFNQRNFIINAGITGNVAEVSSATDGYFAVNLEHSFSGLSDVAAVNKGHVNEAIAEINKVTLGLGNVNNTSDLNKPISTATQSALNAKLNTNNGVANVLTVNGKFTADGTQFVFSNMPIDATDDVDAETKGVPLYGMYRTGTILKIRTTYIP